MLCNIKLCPTKIAKLVPLLASTKRHHNASWADASGVWFPNYHLILQVGYCNRRILWRLKWPQHIIDALVTSETPPVASQITTWNSPEVCSISKQLRSNLTPWNGPCWENRQLKHPVLAEQRNCDYGECASTPTLSVWYHQRYHCYVPQDDYLLGQSNPVSKVLFRDLHLTWQELITSFSPYLP